MWVVNCWPGLLLSSWPVRGMDLCKRDVFLMPLCCCCCTDAAIFARSFHKFCIKSLQKPASAFWIWMVLNVFPPVWFFFYIFFLIIWVQHFFWKNWKSLCRGWAQLQFLVRCHFYAATLAGWEFYKWCVTWTSRPNHPAGALNLWVSYDSLRFRLLESWFSLNRFYSS